MGEGLGAGCRVQQSIPAPNEKHVPMLDEKPLVPKLNRRLSLFEEGRFQSVPQQLLQKMRERADREKFPAREVDAAVGDAMSLAVLMPVLARTMDAAGLTQGLVEMTRRQPDLCAPRRLSWHLRLFAGAGAAFAATTTSASDSAAAWQSLGSVGLSSTPSASDSESSTLSSRLTGSVGRFSGIARRAGAVNLRRSVPT